MPRTHGANKSILFAQIVDPYEVTLDEFAQIKDALFAHAYKALWVCSPNSTYLFYNVASLLCACHSRFHCKVFIPIFLSSSCLISNNSNTFSHKVK